MPALRSLSRRDRIAGLDRGLRLIEAFDETHPRLSPSTAARRTGVTRAAAIQDRRVDNVAHCPAGPMAAHNYWDNEIDFVRPLAALLKEIAG